MIKCRVRGLHQIDGGVNLIITIQYPRFPQEPHQRDFSGDDWKTRFDAAKKQFELKLETYKREKQEIDLIHLGLVNLFQDDDQV